MSTGQHFWVLLGVRAVDKRHMEGLWTLSDALLSLDCQAITLNETLARSVGILAMSPLHCFIIVF